MSVSTPESTSCEDDEEKEASLRYHQAGEEADVEVLWRTVVMMDSYLRRGVWAESMEGCFNYSLLMLANIPFIPPVFSTVYVPEYRETEQLDSQSESRLIFGVVM